MTDSAPTSPSAETDARPYLAVWAECLTQVLTQVASTPFGVEFLAAAPTDAPPAEEGDVHAQVAASGSLRGEMSLRLPRLAALALGQIFLGEAQDAAAEFKADHREAVLELLRQVAGQVATSLKPRWGEVQLHVELGGPPSWPPGASGWLGTAAGVPCRLWLEWHLSAALAAALRSQAAVSGESAVAEPERASETPEGKFDLLMDVGLDVTLRFGGRRMLLRDILELSAGSVVELDRQVQEPVELLLDGRLIARGEAVVVDGNYGLRVLEVISPQGLA